MPFEYAIDAKAHLVRIWARGRITDEEYEEYLNRQLSDPDLIPGMHGIVDMTGVTELAVSSEGIWKIATTVQGHAKVDPSARVVVLVASDEVFGMMRMFQLLSEQSLPNLLVTTDRAEAEAWVSAPPAT